MASSCWFISIIEVVALQWAISLRFAECVALRCMGLVSLFVHSGPKYRCVPSGCSLDNPFRCVFLLTREFCDFRLYYDLILVIIECNLGLFIQIDRQAEFSL